MYNVARGLIASPHFAITEGVDCMTHSDFSLYLEAQLFAVYIAPRIFITEYLAIVILRAKYSLPVCQ